LGSRTARKLERLVLFPDRYVGWIPFATRAGLSLARKHPVEIVYSTFSDAMTSHLIGSILRSRLGVPWIASFHDPWTENLFNDIPTAVHARLADVIEAHVMHSADHIVVTTEPHRQMVLRKYASLGGDRVSVLSSGYHEEDFRKPAPALSSKFTLTHFGHFHNSRSPGPLAQAMAACCREDPSFPSQVRVVLLGGFDAEAWWALRAIASRETAVNEVFEIRGKVSTEDGLEMLRASHVLVLVGDNTSAGRNLLPSKIFDYLPTGRPVLALVPAGSPAAQLIRSASAGIVVPPDDPEAIKAAVLLLRDAWARGALGTSVDAQYVRNFEWMNLTRKFVALLDRLCPLPDYRP
jgi:glycosyltransferase involved in cell wall biosynthesis